MVENEENFEQVEDVATEEVSDVTEAPVKKSAKKNEKRWYIVHTYSGYENKVKTDLEKRIEYMNMGDKIFRIEVPQKTVTQMKAGKKQEKEEKIFPGYVLVEMIMSDEVWFIVRNTQGVTGFIGSSGKGAKPIPLFPEEVERILSSMNQNKINIEKDLKEFFSYDEGFTGN